MRVLFAKTNFLMFWKIKPKYIPAKIKLKYVNSKAEICQKLRTNYGCSKPDLSLRTILC